MKLRMPRSRLDQQVAVAPDGNLEDAQVAERVLQEVAVLAVVARSVAMHVASPQNHQQPVSWPSRIGPHSHVHGLRSNGLGPLEQCAALRPDHAYQVGLEQFAQLQDHLHERRKLDDEHVVGFEPALPCSAHVWPSDID